jgi:hypothetical protein
MSRGALSFNRPLGTRKMPDSLAVRFALRELPVDVQHKIMCIVHTPPPAPRKVVLSKRLQGFIDRWKDPKRPKIMSCRTLF